MPGATPIETAPVEPQPAETLKTETTQPPRVAFENIIADVAAGGTKYVGRTVTIVAPVRFKFDTSVTLFTNNEDVSFFLRSPDAPDKLNAFQEGRRYRITVEITRIDPPDEEFDTYGIFSDIDASQPHTVIGPVKSSVNKIVSDVASGGKSFLGETVSITGEVRFNFANPFPGNSPIGAITLATNNTNVGFYIRDPDKNTGIANLRRFREGQSYNFTVFIYRFTPSTSNPDRTNIFSQFVESN